MSDTPSRVPRPRGSPPACAADAPVLRHLLALGDHYLEEGLRRQAMDVFWSLVHGHPGSREAELARQRLLKLAGAFDREGMHRIARDLYEQLLESDCDVPVRT